MNMLNLWVCSGVKPGNYVIRSAHGCFVPQERIVTVCVEPEHSALEILNVIAEEYRKRGIPLDYSIDKYSVEEVKTND